MHIEKDYAVSYCEFDSIVVAPSPIDSIGKCVVYRTRCFISIMPTSVGGGGRFPLGHHPAGRGRTTCDENRRRIIMSLDDGEVQSFACRVAGQLRTARQLQPPKPPEPLNLLEK